MIFRKNPLVILAYHGLVADTRDVLNDFCFITPQKLDSDLKMVRNLGWSIIGLDEGLLELSGGGLKRPSVAITFDDGLASVVELGSKILADQNCRSTIFIPSEISGGIADLWYTQVLSALRNTRLRHFEFLGRRLSLSDFSARAEANILIQNALRTLHPRAIENMTHELMERLEFEPSIASKEFRVLSQAECVTLRSGGLFEFGAHSATHSIHSQLDEKELRAEIGTSLKFIKSLQSNSPILYAYPNGRKRDFSARCWNILSEHGVFSALSTIPGWNFSLRNKFSLRRFCVGPRTDLREVLSSLRWHWQGWLT